MASGCEPYNAGHDCALAEPTHKHTHQISTHMNTPHTIVNTYPLDNSSRPSTVADQWWRRQDNRSLQDTSHTLLHATLHLAVCRRTPVFKQHTYENTPTSTIDNTHCATFFTQCGTIFVGKCTHWTFFTSLFFFFCYCKYKIKTNSISKKKN